MRFPSFARALLLLAIALSSAVSAQTLTVTPTTQEIRLAPGETLIINGRVTNITGRGLFSTELFLNFSDYPAGAIDIRQLLGDPDTYIPDRTMSPELALFDLVLFPGARPGDVYSFDLFATSLYGDLSNVTTFTVSVVPEPSAAALAACGLMLLGLRARHRRAGQRVAPGAA